YIGVPSGSDEFVLGIFDGDTGKNSDNNPNWTQGYWDTGNFELLFSLYADPDKDGEDSPSHLVGQSTGNTANPLTGSGAGMACEARSAMMGDNAWWDLLVETGALAEATTGNYFYRLDVAIAPGELDGGEATGLSSFKLRTNGASVSAGPGTLAFITPINTMQDFNVLYPNNNGVADPGATDYDGTWSFFFEVANQEETFEIWNGDFDCGDAFGSLEDTDDPNTP